MGANILVVQVVVKFEVKAFHVLQWRDNLDSDEYNARRPGT